MDNEKILNLIDLYQFSNCAILENMIFKANDVNINDVSPTIQNILSTNPEEYFTYSLNCLNSASEVHPELSYHFSRDKSFKITSNLPETNFIRSLIEDDVSSIAKVFNDLMPKWTYQTNGISFRPADIAAKYCSKNVFSFLLENGAPVDDFLGLCAIEGGNYDICVQLSRTKFEPTEKYLEISLKSHANVVASWLASIFGYSEICARDLIDMNNTCFLAQIRENDPDVLKNANFWENSLHKAVLAGNIDLIDLLLNPDFPFKPTYFDQKESIFYCCKLGHNKTLRKIIDNSQYYPNIINESINKNTPLIMAINNDQVECYKVLIEKGCDINYFTDNMAKTALMSAATSENEFFINSLIELKADVNFQNESGNTALMYAANFGNLDYVKKLIENGADPLLKNKKGLIALKFARKQNHEEIVNELRKYGF